MSDRYAYLSCCTEEEREDEGTQDEYLELEASRLHNASPMKGYYVNEAGDVCSLATPPDDCFFLIEDKEDYKQVCIVVAKTGEVHEEYVLWDSLDALSLAGIDVSSFRENTVSKINLNNDPTVDQLQSLFLESNDDAGSHILWVNQDGDVLLSLLPEDLSPNCFQDSQPSLRLRYETFVQGNGYVGPGAAADINVMTQIFESLTKEWENLKPAGRSRYVDTW